MTVVKVDRYYPSSKTCNVCGWKNDSLSLSDRNWTCPQCGTEHDRDVNAAVNILGEGLRVLNGNKSSAGAVDYTGGGSVRPTSVGNRLRSQKPKSLQLLGSSLSKCNPWHLLCLSFFNRLDFGTEVSGEIRIRE